MIAALVVVFVLGVLVGALAGMRLSRRRAYAVCQRQAQLVNGYRPAVPDGFNPAPLPRRRSPNDQPLWQDFPDRQRPVFHD